MIGRALIVVGFLVTIAGVVFSLQGFGVMGGSGGMNGSSFWAAAGPIIAIVGLVLAAAGLYRLRAPASRS
jgi:hypothetical protein